MRSPDRNRDRDFTSSLLTFVAGTCINAHIFSFSLSSLSPLVVAQ